MKKLVLGIVLVASSCLAVASNYKEDVKQESYADCMQRVKQFITDENKKAVADGTMTQDSADHFIKTTDFPQLYCSKKYKVLI